LITVFSKNEEKGSGRRGGFGLPFGELVCYRLGGGAMNASEDERDADEGELLELLNKALSPPDGDVVISVESHDHALLRELWTLQSDGVVVSEKLEKGGTDPGIVWIVLRDADAGLRQALPVVAGVFLKGVLDFVGSLNGKDKKRSKTKVRSRKFSVEVRGFVLRYEDSMDIEVEKAEDDEDDAGGD